MSEVSAPSFSEQGHPSPTVPHSFRTALSLDRLAQPSSPLETQSRIRSRGSCRHYRRWSRYPVARRLGPELVVLQLVARSAAGEPQFSAVETGPARAHCTLGRCRRKQATGARQQRQERCAMRSSWAQNSITITPNKNRCAFLCTAQGQGASLVKGAGGRTGLAAQFKLACSANRASTGSANIHKTSFLTFNASRRKGRRRRQCGPVQANKWWKSLRDFRFFRASAITGTDAPAEWNSQISRTALRAHSLMSCTYVSSAVHSCTQDFHNLRN